MNKRLDHKLDCTTCGTINLSVPADATDDTPINCSRCGGPSAVGATCKMICTISCGERVEHSTCTTDSSTRSDSPPSSGPNEHS